MGRPRRPTPDVLLYAAERMTPERWAAQAEECPGACPQVSDRAPWGRGAHQRGKSSRRASRRAGMHTIEAGGGRRPCCGEMTPGGPRPARQEEERM